ncbi:MAG: FAD-dependent oxidoreductase [Solirubrobacterales bacterium]|nr:FAD-dependent oxidoreductase [Solirubrobacterales bacterium]
MSRRSEAGVVIAGGGLAAQRCAETLRKRGFEAPVRIVCAEDEAPYDRPPLSKDVAAGTADGEAVRFRDADWYADNAVELILGRRAAGLDPDARELFLDDDTRLGWDELLIATGAAPRELPMLSGFANAFPLRTLADAGRLRAALAGGSHLVIVGAGFIGQEVAATARRQGVEVTIVEALDVPLAGILGERVGRWIVDLHRDEGVRVLTGAMLESAAGNGRVEELTLAGGEKLECDAVVVGVGVAPAAAWVAGSGLDPAGIATDYAGRTGLPHVYAAGDVSRPFDPRLFDHVRTEHWDAASRQGVAAGAAMLGETPRPPALPSFWSDQYGLRIQYVGHAEGADEIRVCGEPGERDFHVLYQCAGTPVAALTVDRPRELAAMRRLIESSYEGDAVATETYETPTNAPEEAMP